MNINVIRQEVAQRLADLGLEGYAELPAQPEFPCAIVDLPEVVSFHSDYAHSITTVEVGVRVFVGRGELIDAQRELGDYISTDTPESVTTKVSMAASRFGSSRTATTKLFPMVGSNASAATMCTSSTGNALSAPVIVVPSSPARI